MEIKKLSSRCKCEDEEVRELITNWTKNERWRFDDFITFLELVGVATPVRLNIVENDKGNIFDCLTVDNKKLRISLRFGDHWDFCSELSVTEGDETKTYTTNSKSEYSPQPKVTYQSRNIVKDGKSLNSYYCEFFFHRTLKIDDMHTLSIEFDEPDKYKEDKSNIRVLANSPVIEDYLIGLDNSVSVSEVYEKIVSWLGLNDEDISKIEKILVSYIEGGDKTKRVLAKIFVLKGVMQEYAVRDGDEIFHLFRDRSWRYTFAGTTIIYKPDEKEYIFSVTGTDTTINELNSANTLQQVNEKVSQMWDVFN